MVNQNLGIYYFAYGSNMDLERLIDRKITYKQRERAILKDYNLLFNKKASNGLVGETYGNIKAEKGSIVEGILYLIDLISFDILDIHEGAPIHYKREKVQVITTNNEITESIVYIANKKWIDNGKPTKKYLNHLLAGRDLLSEDYFRKLQSVETID